MQLITHLGFTGQCEEAFRFYETCLGGKIAMMMKYGESPMAAQTEESWRDKVMHAALYVGDAVIMGADAPPGRGSKPSGFCAAIQLKGDEEAEAKRIFAALSEGANVQMPLAPTFWAKQFGMLIDRYGTPWMVNCGVMQ